MSNAANQKLYLQKYLGGPSNDKKKKKKVRGKGFKIVDDNLDLTKLRPLDGDEIDILNGEDAPQIVGIIDDRPEKLRKLDQFMSSSKWRVISQDDGFNSNLKIEEVKTNKKEVKTMNDIVFGKMYSDSEDEQKNNISTSKNIHQSRSNYDFSPPRRDKSSVKSYVYDSEMSISRENSSKQNSRSPSDNDSDASPPRCVNVKQKNLNTDLSPIRKYSKDSSNDKLSGTYQIESRSSRKQQTRVRKLSRWGDFNEELKRLSSESPGPSNRGEKWRGSPARQAVSDKNINKSKQNKLSSSSCLRKSKRDRTPDSDTPSPKRGNYCKNTDTDTLSIEQTKQLKKLHKHNNKRKQESDKDDSNRRHKTQIKNYDKIITSPSKRQDSSNLSPPRKHKKKHGRESGSSRINNDEPSKKKMEKTLEGKTAGLQSAQQLKQENEAFRKREDEVFRSMTDEMSGRKAQIVSRKGKRERSEDRQKQEEKVNRQKALDDKYKKWSRGLKQIEGQEAAVENYMHEASKPLARYKDDRDLDSKLKARERYGDPMLQYMRSKTEKEKGEMLPEKPTYKGRFQPNRFDIPPGYRWDGVDRSNGYERKFIEQNSKKKAMTDEAYKWSTEDL